VGTPIPCFQCISCRCVYSSTGRWDLPTCPRCGCRSGLFVERELPAQLARWIAPEQADPESKAQSS